MSQVWATLILAAATSVSEAEGPSFDEFVAQARAVAGSTARDCGMVRRRQASAPAIACVREASSAGLPYVVVFERPGIDSQVFEALVRTSELKYWSPVWDSDVLGGSRRARTKRSISKSYCDDIQVETKSEGDYGCVQK